MLVNQLNPLREVFCRDLGLATVPLHGSGKKNLAGLQVSHNIVKELHISRWQDIRVAL